MLNLWWNVNLIHSSTSPGDTSLSSPHSQSESRTDYTPYTAHAAVELLIFYTISPSLLWYGEYLCGGECATVVCSSRKRFLEWRLFHFHSENQKFTSDNACFKQHAAKFVRCKGKFNKSLLDTWMCKLFVLIKSYKLMIHGLIMNAL